jgi:hypothetical protein
MGEAVARARTLTQVSDESLRALSRLPALTFLDLGRTLVSRVTNAGVQALRDATPSTRLEIDLYGD